MYCSKCGQKVEQGSAGRVKKLTGCLFPVLFFLVIFGLSALVTIPNMQRKQMKSMQSEAKVYLKEIYAAQKIFYEENGRYTDNFEELGWKPERYPQIYDFYLSDEGVLFSFDMPVDSKGPFASDTSFRVVAVGNIDGDDTLDIWATDNDNNLVNVVNDIVE